MKRTTRRKLEMGKRALDFSRAHPDPDPGYAATVADLATHLARAEELADRQMDGIVDERNATERKLELRQTLTRQYFDHLASVARRAAVEMPDLERQLSLGRLTAERTIAGFRIAARSVAQEAAAQRELLAKYGLSATMLEQLQAVLDRFDVAIEQGIAGRHLHVGATEQLRRVADEVVATVAVLNGFNRARFAQDGEAMRAWTTASNVITTRRQSALPATSGEGAGEGKGEGKEARPAA